MAEMNPDNSPAATVVIDDNEIPKIEYMRIVMSSENFLIPVSAVLGIIRPVALTPVLMAPDHLMGLANIRGQIFCLIDPGKALRMPQARKEATNESRFLLLRHPRVHLGIWVEEVLDLHLAQAPEEQKGQGHSYKLGTVDTAKGTLPVLRVDALFD